MVKSKLKLFALLAVFYIIMFGLLYVGIYQQKKRCINNYSQVADKVDFNYNEAECYITIDGVRLPADKFTFTIDK